MVGGRHIDPSKIQRVALMTIEGEKDDITGLGQCRAAHDLCSGIPENNKYHYECAGVGHYGIFNGRRFRSDIAPRIAQFMRTHDPRSGDDALDSSNTGNTGERATFQRVMGSGYEISSLAFTFAPANDVEPEPATARLRVNGAGTQTQNDGEALNGPYSMPFRLWAMAGSFMIDGLFRMQASSDLHRRRE
jgi:poly(3-hydroxybutyrate) depolymerase